MQLSILETPLKTKRKAGYCSLDASLEKVLGVGLKVCLICLKDLNFVLQEFGYSVLVN